MKVVSESPFVKELKSHVHLCNSCYTSFKLEATDDVTMSIRRLFDFDEDISELDFYDGKAVKRILSNDFMCIPVVLLNSERLMLKNDINTIKNSVKYFELNCPMRNVMEVYAEIKCPVCGGIMNFYTTFYPSLFAAVGINPTEITSCRTAYVKSYGGYQIAIMLGENCKQVEEVLSGLGYEKYSEEHVRAMLDDYVGKVY